MCTCSVHLLVLLRVVLLVAAAVAVRLPRLVEALQLTKEQAGAGA